MKSKDKENISWGNIYLLIQSTVMPHSASKALYLAVIEKDRN